MTEPLAPDTPARFPLRGRIGLFLGPALFLLMLALPRRTGWERKGGRRRRWAC